MFEYCRAPYLSGLIDIPFINHFVSLATYMLIILEAFCSARRHSRHGILWYLLSFLCGIGTFRLRRRKLLRC